MQRALHIGLQTKLSRNVSFVTSHSVLFSNYIIVVLVVKVYVVNALLNAILCQRVAGIIQFVYVRRVACRQTNIA